MWVTIFNSNNSKVNKKREGQMLWSVILFADDIGWSSAHAFLSLQRIYFKICGERNKVNMCKAYLKFWKTDITPEKLENDYQSYIKLKKKRNKSKLDLKAIAKGQVYFKALEQEMMNFIDLNEKELGITELAPFMKIHRDRSRRENEIISLAAYVPLMGDKVAREDTDVNLLCFMMGTCFEIPLLSIEADKQLAYKKFEAKIKNDFLANGKINAFREIFLEFTSPKSLTSSQILIIRSELSGKFKEVTDVIEEFNDDFIKKKITKDNLDEIKEMYTEKLKPCITEFQKVIYNNIYLVQLKNKEDKPRIYRLYIVLTTVRNIVGLYEELKIINKESAMYCRDELHQKGLLGALKFFLYLKVEGY